MSSTRWIALLGVLLLARSVLSQDAENERVVTEIAEKESPPSVRAISPIDNTNAFFLTKEGQIGVAKFTPGLSLIDWEWYSEVHWNSLPDLAIGPEYSLLCASPREITQIFDTDEKPGLDFFQNVVADWPGRSSGVRITAGPVADGHGRLLFALSPHTEEPDGKAVASLVAWTPGSEGLVEVTRSQLPIEDFAISRDSLLAARLLLPGYKDGYYISLTKLPSPDDLASAPEAVPVTRPSLLLPAELTKGATPTQLSFFHENGVEKLLAVCSGSDHLIEIVPSRVGAQWQGAILQRSLLEAPVETIVEMEPGQLLAGGPSGFRPLQEDSDIYRIQSISLADDGIVLDFSKAVDRFAGSKPENYSVQAIKLDGGKSSLAVIPVIESDGESVILRTPNIAAKTVLRVVCQNVPSEGGASLLNTTIFFTVHER